MVENYSLKDSGEVIFICLKCKEKIEKDRMLWVEEEENGVKTLHHLSCYNKMKAEEKK